MKIVILSTNDIKPGAARGAYRLHQSLQSIGIDSQMLVQTKQSKDRTVMGLPHKPIVNKAIGELRRTTSLLPLNFYTQRDSTVYSLQWLPDNIATRVAKLEPDIISLQWVCNGYLQIETLAKFNKPLVWTLRDMWAFTGGCHYNQECDLYTQSCGTCPQLNSQKTWDLSHWVWQRKAKSWKNLNLTIVALSNWLAECARVSSLFRDLPIKVIPNGIDTHKYQPVSRNLARKLMNLPQDKQLVMFGAMSATSDLRKGFHLLQPALQHLSQSEWQDKLEIVVFGASEPIDPPNLGFKCHYLGRLNDYLSLVLAYNATDVMVVPSIQDNLPSTVMEAIACGTPCIAFNIGGMPDMIEHQKNGYLAQPFEIQDLAHGISWILEDPERYQQLSDRARTKTEQEFTLELQASRYWELFQELLAQKSSSQL